MPQPLRVLSLNCSLKNSASPSNTQVLMDEIVDVMRRYGDVSHEIVRVADHHVPPGVELHVAEDDDWPGIALRILQCDVLLFGTPIWLGHPSSLAQRCLERLDHYLFHMDERGFKPMYGKVAGIAITGSEDGGHLVHSQLAQALSDLGFTLPPEARAYWTGWSDQSPGASYPQVGREHPSTVYMREHCGRNLYHFAHAVRQVSDGLPQLDSDIEAAGQSPEEVAERVRRAHS